MQHPLPLIHQLNTYLRDQHSYEVYVPYHKFLLLLALLHRRWQHVKLARTKAAEEVNALLAVNEDSEAMEFYCVKLSRPYSIRAALTASRQSNNRYLERNLLWKVLRLKWKLFSSLLLWHQLRLIRYP
jgi:hypothetical protein